MTISSTDIAKRACLIKREVSSNIDWGVPIAGCPLSATDMTSSTAEMGSLFSRFALPAKDQVEAEISSLSFYGQSSPLDFESVSDGVGKM